MGLAGGLLLGLTSSPPGRHGPSAAPPPPGSLPMAVARAEADLVDGPTIGAFATAPPPATVTGSAVAQAVVRLGRGPAAGITAAPAAPDVAEETARQAR